MRVACCCLLLALLGCDSGVTVTGYVADRYHREAGLLERPRPTGSGPSVLVEGSDGTFRTFASSAQADGLSSVGDLPVGLRYFRHGDLYVWTDVDHVNFVYPRLGREDSIVAPAGTRLSLDVDNMAPWQLDHHLLIFSSNTGDLRDAGPVLDPAVDSTVAIGDVVWATRSLLDPALGDGLQLSQWVTEGAIAAPQIQLIDRTADIADLTVQPATQTPVVATLQAQARSQRVTVNWDSDRFLNERLEVSGRAGLGLGELVVFAQPYELPPRLIVEASPARVFVVNDFLAFGATSETVDFADPYPAAWGRSISATSAWWLVETSTLDGSSESLRARVRSVVPWSGEASVDVDIMVTPPQGFLIDGASAQDTLTGASRTPELTWSAPRSGQATGYVIKLIPFRPGSASVTRIVTTQTRVRIPSGVLGSGVEYRISLTAVSMPNTDLESDPLSVTLPFGTAETISRIVVTQ